MTIATVPQDHPARRADQPKRVRVRVWFGGRVMFTYQADLVAALRYARAMGRRFGSLRVTVDNGAADGLPTMPCEPLWTAAP